MEYDELRKNLATYMSEEYLTLIDKYYEEAEYIYSGMKRKTKEDYIYHSIMVAGILAESKMDPITIGCALIHEAIKLEKRDYEEIENTFGEESAIILESINKISKLKRTFKKEDNSEKYRRIIVGLAENPTALFIKFADRLNNLETIYVHDNEHKMEIIDETENIMIPIAHRLGMKKMMSELEDLCLKNKCPEKYKEIENKIDADRDELNESLDKMKNSIIEILKKHNIEFEILSRVKSVKGIYNKLELGRRWEDIYDLLGIRILVNNIEECYQIIGLIHSKYEPIPKRFKDYIANPKSNMYQSIHTSVHGEDDRIYEIQVRTHEMDIIAERGVASHWSYKEKTDGSVKNELENRLETFRALIEVNDMESNMDFFSNISEELKRKEIYVFTPKGDIIELPSGATPLDFAYKIHSEVGHNTNSALVNNKMVKLDYELSDGDIVELITQKGKAPNPAWLNIVKTESAKSRIKAYFYKNERDKYISLGKSMLEIECKKRKIHLNDLLTDENIKNVCSSLKLESIDDIYFSVSTLRYNPYAVINRFDKSNEKTAPEIVYVSTPKESESPVLIAGNEGILSSLASCCNPVFGEEIVGYITKGFGVKIHSKNCLNVDLNSDRLVDVSWNNNVNNKCQAKLKVFIDSTEDILLHIITLSTKYEINIESMNLASKNKELFYDVRFKVTNVSILNSFITALKEMKFVTRVERAYN